MKLKKPIKVDEREKDVLLSLENKLLFLNGVMVYSDIVFEENTVENKKKKLFGKPYIVKETTTYLTEITVWTYSTKGDFLGTLFEYDVVKLLTYYDLYKLRNAYVNQVRKPLEKLGFEIVKKSVKVSLTYDKKEILKEFSKKMSEQKDCPTEFQEIVNKEYWNLLY